MVQRLKIDWDIITMIQPRKTIDWTATQVNQDLKKPKWHVATMNRTLSSALSHLSTGYNELPLKSRIKYMLRVIQAVYYPILAIVGLAVNIVTIVILSRGKCGLSGCITHYLVAMSVADFLVVILDLMLRHIPTVFKKQFIFIKSVPLCNVHAVLLYTAVDCSVWFTVAFTFDRFVVLCCRKLKSIYCTERTASVVLVSMAVLSGLKNIFWYFMFTPLYRLHKEPWFCYVSAGVRFSLVWGSIEFVHYIVTPIIPFVLILLLNALTAKHILLKSNVRKRLRNQSNLRNVRDAEMENRRRSITLLFLISANFILLWSTLLVSTLWQRIRLLGYTVWLHRFWRDIGFMLQLLSCCTNTCIYVVTQKLFRKHLKNVLLYLFTLKFQANR
ncbi:probable G-protein coupled receptor 139 isoform X1 [Stegostoma tigrinum]|uniref:probable G-protein coupled receptor 139 isoform X1 n=1 Tax=Stegostoma tigrinum TaxID=3053191 RepID=UPI00202B8926|nr:probable G-protein coupled receptor 139 isoform X1 [Stegostoma tigrinum]